MQRLIDLAKGESRVFVELMTPKTKSKFLTQATEEGFMIGNNLPSQCHCEDVMIIHDNYTITYCVGMATNFLYHSSKSQKIDYEKCAE